MTTPAGIFGGAGNAGNHGGRERRTRPLLPPLRPAAVPRWRCPLAMSPAPPSGGVSFGLRRDDARRLPLIAAAHGVARRGWQPAVKLVSSPHGHDARHRPVPSRRSGLAAGWGRLVPPAPCCLPRPCRRRPTRRLSGAPSQYRICLAGSQMIPWFTLLAALFSLVLVHIVVVTAQSYGLSHLALGMVVARAGGRATACCRPRCRRRAPRRQHRADGIGPAYQRIPGRAHQHSAPCRAAARGCQRTDGRCAGLRWAALALLLSYFGVYGFTPWGLSASRAPSARSSTRWSPFRWP